MPAYNAGMYPIRVKQNAIELRKSGFSLNEIVKELGIAKGTASVWVRNVVLKQDAVDRLRARLTLGQVNYIRSVEARKEQKKIQKEEIKERTRAMVKDMSFSQNTKKLLCALLFWAEGAKNTSEIKFSNSDPYMIQVFLHLLRTTFEINESKLHAIVHIHSYHNDNEIKCFWSGVTKIPLEQFYRSYKKPHTGKRKKKDYKGCINISYFDRKIALELYYLYNSFAHSITAT